MEDFRAGRDINVGGNVTITNEANHQPKLLSLCTNEELRAERTHRQKLLLQERYRKNSVGLTLLGVAVAVGVALYLYNEFIGSAGLANLVIGALGVAFPVVLALKGWEQQTQFEARQLATLNEIAMLLRERGSG